MLWNIKLRTSSKLKKIFGGRRRPKHEDKKILQLYADIFVITHIKIKETEITDFAIGEKIQMQGRNDSVKVFGTVESIRRKADFATQKATSENC